MHYLMHVHADHATVEFNFRNNFYDPTITIAALDKLELVTGKFAATLAYKVSESTAVTNDTPLSTLRRHSTTTTLLRVGLAYHECVREKVVEKVHPILC